MFRCKWNTYNLECAFTFDLIYPFPFNEERGLRKNQILWTFLLFRSVQLRRVGCPRKEQGAYSVPSYRNWAYVAPLYRNWVLDCPALQKLRCILYRSTESGDYCLLSYASRGHAVPEYSLDVCCAAIHGPDACSRTTDFGKR